MKKFFAIVCMMLMSTAMFAQAGSKAVGLNLGYGLSENYKPFGIGAKFQYEFIDNVRAEVAGNYWFPKDDYTVIDAMLNFHYLIGIGSGMNVYPLAGLGLINMAYVGDYKDVLKAAGVDTHKMVFGWNVGVGFEYNITSNIKVNAEVKYQYGKSDGWKIDWDPIQIGVAYCF